MPSDHKFPDCVDCQFSRLCPDGECETCHAGENFEEMDLVERIGERDE